MRNFKFLSSSLSLILSLTLSFYTSYGQTSTSRNTGANAPKTGKIAGKIIDELTGEPLEYVNVVVFKSTDQSLVSGAITNQKGDFFIESLPTGSFILKVSYIGFQDYKSEKFTLSPQAPFKKLETIRLSMSAATLEAAEIKGEKRLMEYSLDKKIINIEQNLVSDGGTAVDVLNNVPAISVDEEGNVSMKGSTNVTILIDGRPAVLSGMGLDQIAANTIDNIEIISNPSAKYNPEGMSGILNIRTKKRTFSGVNGMINLSTSTANRNNGSANINVGLGKVNLFAAASGNYMNSQSKGSYNTSTNLGNDIYPNYNKKYEIGENKSSRAGLGGNFKLGADYRINRNHTLTLSGQIGLWENERYSLSPDTRTYLYDSESVSNPSDGILSQSIYNEDARNSSFKQLNGVLAYKWEFDQPKQEFTVDMSYDYNRNSSDGRTIKKYMNPLGDSTSTLLKNSFGDGIDFDAQVNYVQPITDKIRVEMGYQGKIRTAESNETQYPRVYELQDTAINFEYIQNIHGIYANFQAEIEKFSFQVGGRYEAASIDANTVSELKDSAFNYPYARFYPSIHAAYKLSKNQEIQVSYSRRVNRPSFWNLNPFIDYSNYPLSISLGNPNLIPEDVHSFEINHSLFLGKTSFYTNLYYRQINDVIRRYTYVQEDGMRVSQPFNYDQGTNYGVNLTWEQQINSWWRFNVNTSLYRNITVGSGPAESVNTEKLSYNARVNMNFNLPKFFYIQLNARYNGPTYWGQMEMLPNFSSEIALRKGFYKNKLTLGVRFSDIFNTRKHNSITTGTNFSTESIRTPLNSRAIYLSISYKINQGIKSSQKKKNTNEGASDGEFEM